MTLLKNALIAVYWAKYSVTQAVEVVEAMELRIQLPDALVVLVTVIKPRPILQLIPAVLVAAAEQDLLPKLVLLVAETKCLPILTAHTL